MLLSIGDRVKVKIPVTDPATRERTGEVVQVPAKVVGFYQDAQTQQKQVEVKYPNDTITVVELESIVVLEKLAVEQIEIKTQ